jgi:transposase-like protein
MDSELNLIELGQTHLRDKASCIEWLMNLELIPRERKCPKCKKQMAIDKTTDGHGLGRFRCNRKHASGNIIEKQIAEGTWFEGAKTSPMKVMALVYAFANKMSEKQAIRESKMGDVTTSSETVVDWYGFCREVCMDALDRKYDEGEIGGPGHVVEIDECKIGRRKNHAGRVIDGHWILGMIDHDGGFRLEICPENKRDKETLLALILKHVAPDTTIMTDCWKGYNDLDQEGFEHFTVNHKYHFVDPDTGANTQRIESQWRPIRRRLTRGGVKDDHLAMHLCEFLWFKEIERQKLDPFNELLKDIKRFKPLRNN